MALNIRRLLKISSVSDLFKDFCFLAFLDELADHLFVVASAFPCINDNVRALSFTHLYSYLSACQTLLACPIREEISTPASEGSSPSTLGLCAAPGAGPCFMGSVPSNKSTPLYAS